MRHLGRIPCLSYFTFVKTTLEEVCEFVILVPSALYSVAVIFIRYAKLSQLLFIFRSYTILLMFVEEICKLAKWCGYFPDLSPALCEPPEQAWEESCWSTTTINSSPEITRTVGDQAKRKWNYHTENLRTEQHVNRIFFGWEVWIPLKREIFCQSLHDVFVDSLLERMTAGLVLQQCIISYKFKFRKFGIGVSHSQFSHHCLDKM